MKYFLGILLLTALAFADRHRHRHRHHRKRSIGSNEHFEEVHPYIMSEGVEGGLHFAIVDEPPIHQILISLLKKGDQFGFTNKRIENVDKLCSYKSKVEDSIKTVLNFYHTHFETQGETAAAGLAFVKGLVKKHGSDLLKNFPVSSWIAALCDSVPIKQDIGFCLKYVKGFERIGMHSYTKIPHGVLKKAAEKYNKIGHDNEILFGELNAACLGALLLRCEVPHACNRVMFDPEPMSQYMLTHQLLHRMLAGQMECLKEKEKFVNSEVELELCAKMYKEAELISGLEGNATLTLFRDLFAEQISFCGQIGYDSFLRVDWLEKLLSWQSKSEYGCFLQVDPLLMDIDEIPRKLTIEEKQNNLQTTEVCETHFTSVGLSALATFWDHMQQNCS